jgi:DNA polymerase-3 subunit alpha
VDLRLVNKRVLESLVKCGAFDSLYPAGADARVLRPRLLAAIDLAMEHGARRQRDRLLGQTDLFGDGGMESASDFSRGEAPPWNEAQQLTAEKEALGLYLSGHPIDRFAAALRAYGARRIVELTASEADVRVGGVITGVRHMKTRKGDRMAAFTLEDREGALETVAFPEALAKYASLIADDAMVVVRGKLDKDEDSARLLAAEIIDIDIVQEAATRGVEVRLVMPPHTRGTVEALKNLFARHRGDRPVELHLDVRERSRAFRVTLDVPADLRVRPSARLVAEVEQLCGQGSILLR